MKKIVEYLPLLTICLIYFGFCNIYFYFKEFKIDIYNYISSPEILLSFFPTIVIIIGVLGSVFIQTLVNEDKPIFTFTSKEKNNEEDEEDKSGKFWNLIFYSLFTWMIVFLSISFAGKYILLKLLNYKPYELQSYNLIRSMLFIVMLMWYVKLKDQIKLVYDNVVLVCIFCIVYIGIQFSEYRKMDAMKVKAGISDMQMTFKYHAQIFKTTPTIVFVGQTQANLFLYDTKKANTIVYKVENIDSLIIK